MAILFVMALSWHARIYGQEISDTLNLHKNRNLTVSLITCYPGEEIYELCGHSAIRVRGEGIDSVWNYGIFDFSQPNFVYRFVKGETDYKGASYPFRWFLPEYVKAGRKVVEQDINFTPQEAERMLEILRESVLPENATYRYNYVKDNCSTRILNHVDSASEVVILYPDTIRYGTFRKEMEAYHEGYPWYQFGIDLALGSGLDVPINSREEMFVPVELERNAESAHFADGRKFIKETRVLNEGKEDATLPPTPWWAAPVLWAWILTAILILGSVYDIYRTRITYPVYDAWFFMLGLAGCLIFFLVFISVHEATTPNVLIFWLNPLQFIFVLGLSIRKLRIAADFMAWYNIIAVGLLLVLSPFYTQRLNAAFYPLMLSTFIMASGYAIIRAKKGYKYR